MKRIATVLGLLAVLGLPAPGMAGDFSYRWGQVTYDLADIETDDGDGFGFSGSFEVTPDIFVQGAYRFWDMDSGLDADAWEVSVGYRRGLDSRTDVYGTFGLGSVQFGLRIGPFLLGTDVDYWALRGGVRYWLQEKVEVGGTAGIVAYDPGDTEFELGVNGQYYFTPRLSGFASYTVNDAVSVLSAGARFYF